MTPERWRQVCALFTAALRCTPSERDLLLREACAGHSELGTEVDRLLAGDAQADEDGFLRVPDALSSTQDQVCDRFGATWRAGDRPQIAATPPPEIPGMRPFPSWAAAAWPSFTRRASSGSIAFAL